MEKILTNKQISYLKSLAHSMKFIVQTGGKGLSENVLLEIDKALDSHELIKVKLNADKDDRDKMLKTIIKTQKCELINSIGRVVVLFKQNKKDPQIELPSKK